MNETEKYNYALLVWGLVLGTALAILMLVYS